MSVCVSVKEFQTSKNSHSTQSLFKGTLKGQLCHLSRLKSKIQNHFHDSSTCNVGNGTLFINRAPPAGLRKDGKTLAACPERQQIIQIYLETFNLRQKKNCNVVFQLTKNTEETCFRSFHQLSVSLRSFKEPTRLSL